MAASITKHPASKGPQKSTQSTKAKPAAKRRNSNLSAAGPSKKQLERKASNKSLFDSAPVKKANISKREEKKPQSFPRGSSSDFGDDDFEDLPSPSWLFGTTKSSLAMHESAMVDISQSTDPEAVCVDPAKLTISDKWQSNTSQDSTSVDPIPEAAATQALIATQASQPFESPKHSESVKVWDDFSYDSGEEIFTNPGYQDSSATTAAFVPSTTNTTRTSNPKREASTSGKDPPEQNQKLLQEYSPRGTFPASSAVAVPDSTSIDREDCSPMAADDSSTGWEDVDRGLLEEYKHIINFY